MSMNSVSTKESPYWALTRTLIWTGFGVFVTLSSYVVISVFVSPVYRVSIQDGSTQACFVK